MNLNSSKYVPKLGHPQIAHYSNLSPSLDSRVADQSRTTQILFGLSQLGPFWSKEQFLDNLILVGTP